MMRFANAFNLKAEKKKEKKKLKIEYTLTPVLLIKKFIVYRFINGYNCRIHEMNIFSAVF